MFDNSFSVIISVYKNDKLKEFKSAIESISIKQKLTPSEIIIIIDGPIGKDINDYIYKCKSRNPLFKVIKFENNQGHAKARQAGVEAATNNLIAIMDADDISAPERFQLQMEAYRKHPNVAAIGGQIEEFEDTTNKIVGKRIVPESPADINHYLKSRCPMNLVTVMFRKDIIQNVGGFQDWFCEEDYFLWIRLIHSGYSLINIPQNLVRVRVGKDMYARRGGLKYFKSEKRLQDLMYRKKMISCSRYFYNVMGRFVIQVVLPNKVRGFVFQKLFRK